MSVPYKHPVTGFRICANCQFCGPFGGAATMAHNARQADCHANPPVVMTIRQPGAGFDTLMHRRPLVNPKDQSCRHFRMVDNQKPWAELQEG